jgi:response regulator of citrate/malate metabolism
LDFSSYSFDVSIENIDFSNSLVLVDADASNIDILHFSSNLVKITTNDIQILVLSSNCDRKNINDFAKHGVDRFIVKPINKKRFKVLIEPYINYSTSSSDETDSELIDSSSSF